MSGVRSVQDEGTSCADGLGLSAVHDVRGSKAEPGMAMMGVVGVEEVGAERPRILQGGGEGILRAAAAWRDFDNGSLGKVLLTWP